MDMRRVLCLVLLIALGEAAVRYPRGYSVEGDLQYGDKNKNEAYYALKAGDVTKGGKYIKGREFSSNIDAAYQLLNKKEYEIYNNEEQKVDLNSIAVKDIEHSITVENSDNIGSIALSRDSSSVSLPISVLASSYSSNSDHSIDVKNSNNVPSDSIIGSDNSSGAESSSSGNVENSESVNISDNNMTVKGSYSSDTEHINVKSRDSSGSVFATFLSFFTSGDGHDDTAKSSSSNDELHSSEVKSSDGYGSIINSLLSFFTNERYQGDANESSSFSDSVHNSDVNITNNNSTTIEAQLHYSKIGQENSVIESSSSSEAEHSGDIKSDVISGSITKTQLSDSITGQEPTGITESSSSSNAEFISKVKSIYSNGTFILRAAIRYMLNRSDDGDGSDIEINDSDIPKIKILLSSLSTERNQGDAIESSLSSEAKYSGDVKSDSSSSSEAEHSGDIRSDDIHESIIRTKLSDSISGHEDSRVIESSSSSNAELISKVKSIYSNGTFMLRTAIKYVLNRSDNGDSSDIEINDSDIPRIKILLSALSTERNQGDQIESSSHSEAEYSGDVKSDDIHESIIKTQLSDSITGHEDSGVIESSSSSNAELISKVKSIYSNGNFLLRTAIRYMLNRSDNGDGSDIEINDSDIPIVKIILSSISTESNQGDANKSSSSSEAEYSGNIKSDDIHESIIKTQLSDSITGHEDSGVIESSSSSNAELISKVKSIYSNGDFLLRTAIRYMLNRSDNGDGSDIEINDSDIPIVKIILSSISTEHNQGDANESSSSSEAEHSGNIKSDDIHESIIKTQLSDSITGHEDSGVIKSSSSSNAELISKVKSIYSNGDFILRTAIRYMLNRSDNGDGSDIEINDSDIPIVKIILSSISTEHNQGDANESSSSSEAEHSGNIKSDDIHESIIKTQLSDSITGHEDSGVMEISSSSNAELISKVKSIYSNGTFLLRTAIRHMLNRSDNGDGSDIEINDSDIPIVKIILSSISTERNQDDANESSPSSEAEHSGDIKSDDIHESIIRTKLSDSISGHEDRLVIESSSSSNAELISKFKSIYSNGTFLLRPAIRLYLNKSDDSDGSDIEINDSDIPRIKILLSYLSTGRNQGDANESSSSSNNNEPIMKPLISIESHHDSVIENNYSKQDVASSQKVGINNTQVSDITNKNDNLIGNIRFGDTNEENNTNLSKKGDINSNSGSISYGHSGIIKDKNNCKNSHGTHHQTDDKGGSHQYGHVIPHKHSEESSESSESSEESNESKDSHSREHDHDFEENSYHHHEDGHKITKRSSERSGVNLKKSETKHKDERKVEEGINTAAKEQRIKRSGEYYRYNHGRNSEESGERYKKGYYRRSHGDSDSDSTSEESSEERGSNRGNTWRTDRVGSWGRRVRRSGGYYFGNGGYHYNSGESFDNSNEGGEREYYNYNRRPGFGFGQGSGESKEGY